MMRFIGLIFSLVLLLQPILCKSVQEIVQNDEALKFTVVAEPQLQDILRVAADIQDIHRQHNEGSDQDIHCTE